MVKMKVELSVDGAALEPEAFLVHMGSEERSGRHATFSNTRGENHSEALIRADVLSGFLEQCGG